jgi:putative cardiolipin synthase
MRSILLIALLVVSVPAVVRAQAADPYAGIAIPAPPASVADQDVAELRRAFDGLSQQVGRGSARIVEDNVDAWWTRWAMLERAGTSIDITYFIFDKDIFGMSLLGNLYRQQKRGRRVRMMIDASGDSLGTKGFKASARGQDYLQELVQAGGTVKTYHPYFKKAVEHAAQTLRNGVGTSVAVVASNHDKIMVVDNKWSIVGGRNISLNYFLDAGDFPEVFRDIDVLADIPQTARDLTRAFEIEFNRDDLTFTVQKEAFGRWVKRDVELIAAYLLMDAWLRSPALGAAEAQRLRTDRAARRPYIDTLMQQVESRLSGEGVSGTNAWDRYNLRSWAEELTGYPLLRGRSGDPLTRLLPDVASKVLDRTSASGDNPGGLNDELIALATGARKKLVIANPYVVLSQRAIAALRGASDRGVDIYLLTNSPASTDSALTQAFFIEAWPSVEAQVPRLRVFVMAGKRKLHAKCAVMDDVLSFVSTYNLDFISAHVNSEVGAAMWSPALAAQLTQAIRADLYDPANQCKEYTIQKDAAGNAVMQGGSPVVVYGAKNHLSPEVWSRYETLRKGSGKMTDLLGQLKPLRESSDSLPTGAAAPRAPASAPRGTGPGGTPPSAAPPVRLFEEFER